MEKTVVQLLLFANDLMLVAENDEDVERNLRVLDEVMEKWKMRINWTKTKVLTVKKRRWYMRNFSERGEN